MVSVRLSAKSIYNPFICDYLCAKFLIYEEMDIAVHPGNYRRFKLVFFCYQKEAER